MSIVATKPLTAEELFDMGDIGRCELVLGELIMMSPAGAAHGVVALRIGRAVSEFVDRHDLGLVFAAETGFVLDRDPDTVRAADVSFVRKARLAGGIPVRFFEGPPDLAVEVNSPGDTKREVSDKVNLWLAKGTEAVWVAEPQTQTVTVHRVGAKPLRYGGDQTLDGSPLLAGFEMRLGPIFSY